MSRAHETILQHLTRRQLTL